MGIPKTLDTTAIEKVVPVDSRRPSKDRNAPETLPAPHERKKWVHLGLTQWEVGAVQEAVDSPCHRPIPEAIGLPANGRRCDIR